MRSAKFLFSCLLVVALFIASGQVIREAYLWLTTPAIDPDRSKDIPSLENIDVAHSLRIATAPLGTSAVWLFCGRDTKIRMVLHTRLPIEETYLRNGRYEGIQVYVSRWDADQRVTGTNTDNMYIGNATLRRDDGGDLVVTPVLAPDAVSFFLRSPAAHRRDRMWISLMETGTRLQWNAGVGTGSFVDRCNAER